MRGTDLLRMQLTGSCAMIAERSSTAEPVWQDRAFPGTSRPGFVLWHCARIVDWGVNTVARRGPEIGEQDAWRARVRHDLGHGAGLTDEQADEVARTVTAADVAAYADALGADIAQWLDSAGDDELDRLVDLRAANARHPLYATPAAWEEVEGLDGLPVWQVLARPCISHIRMHMGELDTLLAALATARA